MSSCLSTYDALNAYHRFADREDPLDPAVAVLGLGATADPAQNDRVSEGSFRGVVVHRDVKIGDVAEGPQRVVLLEQSGAVVRGLLIVAARAPLKQRLDRGAQRCELLA